MGQVQWPYYLSTATALVAIDSMTAANWGKVPRVYKTPPHFSTPAGYHSLLLVWVWVGGFQNLTAPSTLEAKWQYQHFEVILGTPP